MIGDWAGLMGWSHAATSGPPVPSGELGPAGLGEGPGLLPLRAEGTASGWPHRAASTSHSMQWKDNGSVLLGPK